jgi:hypothetical protein
MLGPTIRLRISQRWLPSEQQSRFVPFDQRTYWLWVETSHDRADARTHFVTLDSPIYPTGRAIIEATADGRSQRVVRATRALFGSRTLQDSVRAVRGTLTSERPLALLQSRLWEIIPPFHPARLQRGEHWSDTLTFAAEEFGLRQAMSGVRVSTLLADTTIEGRRLWLVRDSALVSYEETTIENESTLDSIVFIVRSGKGVVRGRMLYDPERGLFRERVDTAALSGSARLIYPDGLSFDVPARFERRRRWDLYDSTTREAWDLAVLAERTPANLHGPLNTPPIEIFRRRAAGDSSFKDSVVAVLLRSDDPNERASILSKSWIWQGDTALVRKVHEIRVASGDSAYLIRLLLDRLMWAGARPSSDIDVATMRRAIQLMERPSAFLVNRDESYRSLAAALVRYLTAADPATSQLPCTPAACALLADQWRIAREPRLKRLGLLTHFVLEPRRWTDSILADTTSPLLRDARMLAHGVAVNAGKVESNHFLPAAGASWRAWVDWMIGPPQPPRLIDGSIPVRTRRELVFGPYHLSAIRFVERTTSRNIAAELRAMRSAATSDSARGIAEFLLFKLGAHRPTVSSVVAHVRSGSELGIELGAVEVSSLFSGKPARADNATTDLLIGGLLGMAFGSNTPWRVVSPRILYSYSPYCGHLSSSTALLLADSVPQSLRAKWSAQLVTRAGWNARSPRPREALCTLSSVTRVGPFARLGVQAFVATPYSSGQVDRRHLTNTYHLMELDGEWVLLDTASDVTVE